MKNFFVTTFTIYFIICLLLFIFQRHFIFLPMKWTEDFSGYSLKNSDEVILTTTDNEKIISWYKKSKSNDLTIVFFHGNAGNLIHRIEKLTIFNNFSAYGLLAIDYRGYGKSSGKPSEIGFYQDARAAINFLKKQGIAESNMIFYGESIGSAVAIKMATEYSPRFIVLEAPFTSIKDIANEGIFRFFPVSLLLQDNFPSINLIKEIKSPILIVHGIKDTIIPLSHSYKLYQKITTENKKLLLYEELGHNNMDPNKIIRDIVQFNDSLQQNLN